MTRPEMKIEPVSYDRAKGREHMEEKNVMISITGLQKVDGVEQEPVELITPATWATPATCIAPGAAAIT